MLKRGFRGATLFRKTFFTWSHHDTVRAVAVGLAQAGAVDGYIWETLARIEPELTRETRVAAKSDWYGFPPIVARASLAPNDLEAIRRVFVTMDDDDEGQRLLGRMNLDGFVPGEVAKRLHALAFPGEERPFIAVDCGALSEALLESELFGHERGAFTGAVRARRGVFEQADGGTLFFDEIANMPLGMQMKLLRVLQDRLVMRVGGEQRREVDFRLICATNRDLKPLVRSGEFREDLYYRINVVHIEVPPLRERHEDILWLADRFLEAHNEAHPEASRVWGPAARESLTHYPWPGNVRELKHCIERAWVMCHGPALECEDLAGGFKSVAAGRDDLDSDLRTYLRGCERTHIVEVLERNDWVIGRSAGELGISRKKPVGANAPSRD